MTLIKDKNAKSLSYYIDSKVPVLTKELLDEIKEIAFETKQNVRVCFHEDNNQDLHNMIILQWKGKEFKIHKHSKNIEICQIIEGQHRFNIYEGNGENLLQSIKMTETDNSIVRINKSNYHLSIPITQYVIFHEIKLGPFDPNDNIFIEE